MTKTIRFTLKLGGVLTDATSVVLRDPTAAFGMRRTDTQAVIAAAGTALSRVSTGLYQYTFAEPAAGLVYQYFVEWLYAGETRRIEQFLETAPAPAPGGIVPIAPTAYVQLGIDAVSCGDSALAEFLTAQANLVWALQARRGVALDLRYQYYVLDLLTLALDHVRMLIDTERASTQNVMQSYNNGTNVSDSHSSFRRTRDSSLAESAASSQSSIRSAFRTSSMTSSEGASRDSSRAMASADHSHTQNDSVGYNRRTVDNSLTTDVHQIADSGIHSETQVTLTASGGSVTGANFTRLQQSYPFVATISDQHGDQNTNGGTVRSILPGQGRGQTYGFVGHDGTVTGRGTVIGRSNLTTTSTRVQAVTRTSTSTMTGSSFATSSSSLSSGSHSEQHRTSSSSFHSEYASHSETAADSLAHREASGALATTGTTDMERQYYSQISQSLQEMWKDTVQQIQRLEQQVALAGRYLVEKLGIKTPQAGLVQTAARQTDRTIIQRPAGPRGNTALGGFERFTIR